MSWGPARIDVFALQPDGSIGHTWWDGQIWNQWQPLGPPDPGISLVGTPSVITWGPGRLDVFVSGSDSNLYHYTQTAGAFGAPESLGAPVVEVGCQSLGGPSLPEEIPVWQGSRSVPAASRPGVTGVERGP